MTATVPQRRLIKGTPNFAATSPLLRTTACQSDGEESADPCTGLSHELLNYFMDGEEFTTSESGDFPYNGSIPETTWGCTIEVDGEDVFMFVGGIDDDLTMPSSSYSSEYFTYRGGVGFSEAYEGEWLCENIVIHAGTSRDPFAEEKLAAVLIALAQETGCRMEAENQ